MYGLDREVFEAFGSRQRLPRGIIYTAVLDDLLQHLPSNLTLRPVAAWITNHYACVGCLINLHSEPDYLRL